MTAYTFYIDSGYHDYQSIWDNPLADGDLLCDEKQETDKIYTAGRGYQDDD